jgi:hypothetical protein
MKRLLCVVLGHRWRCESYAAFTFDWLEIYRVRRCCERCGKEAAGRG